MKFHHKLAGACLALATGFAGAQSGSSATQAPGAGPGMPLTAAQQQSMLKLQQAADRLRDAIAAMRGKSDMAERDRAIGQAQEALATTQQAMRELPAEIRNAPAAAVTPAQYDASVEKMMQAADALRKSTQAMAKLPAGSERNDAMRQANQALLETQRAMVSAYMPGAGTNAMGARGTSSGSSPVSPSGSGGK